MSETQDRTPSPAGPVSPTEVSRVKQKAATLSVIASIVLTLAKFGAAILSGSLALLTDAELSQLARAREAQPIAAE